MLSLAKNDLDAYFNNHIHKKDDLIINALKSMEKYNSLIPGIEKICSESKYNELSLKLDLALDYSKSNNIIDSCEYDSCMIAKSQGKKGLLGVHNDILYLLENKSFEENSNLLQKSDIDGLNCLLNPNDLLAF